jgi:Leucine-rich repeat (LRR) protein
MIITFKIILEILLVMSLTKNLVRSQTNETNFNWSRLVIRNRIEVRYSNLKHLNGIEIFKTLVYLDVKNNLIQNLNPLRNLTNLNHLELASNRIESIEALENLIKLEYLDISSNLIKSVDLLANLKMLKTLHVENSRNNFFCFFIKVFKL